MAIKTTEQKQLAYLRKQLQEVRSEANALFNKIQFRRRIGMFTYPKGKLNLAWNITDLYERSLAAHALGWEIAIRADNDGLHVDYIEKLPTSRPSTF